MSFQSGVLLGFGIGRRKKEKKAQLQREKEAYERDNKFKGLTGVSTAFGSVTPTEGAFGSINYNTDSPIATQAAGITRDNLDGAEQLSSNISGVFNGTNENFNKYRGVFDTQFNQLKGETNAKFSGQNNNALSEARRDATNRELSDYNAQQPYNFVNNVLAPTQNTLLGAAGNAQGIGTNALQSLQQAFQVASGANTNALQLQQNQNQFDQALKQSKRNSVQSLLAGLLPVAGALVGTAIGGPFGAAIGGITGEAAAKATSPKKTQAQPF